MLAIGVTLATIVSFALVSSPTAGAATSKNVFAVHVRGDVAMAANGETTTVVVTGVFDVAAKTASGSGTFMHRASDGTLLNSGTLTITGLTAFQFFGCGFTPDGNQLPPNFCGGRAILTMEAHPADAPGVNVDAILTVTCDLTGGGSPPPGQPEGITVDVPGHLNFNQSVSGNTLFVSQ